MDCNLRDENNKLKKLLNDLKDKYDSSARDRKLKILSLLVDTHYPK